MKSCLISIEQICNEVCNTGKAMDMRRHTSASKKVKDYQSTGEQEQWKREQERERERERRHNVWDIDG